jgi:hypothetical protein
VEERDRRHWIEMKPCEAVTYLRDQEQRHNKRSAAILQENLFEIINAQLSSIAKRIAGEKSIKEWVTKAQEKMKGTSYYSKC